MKSFYISISLFAILIIAITSNAIYVNNEIEEICQMVRGIPDPTEDGFNDALQSATERWQKFKRKAGYTCSYSELNKIQLEFDDLAIFAAEKNHSDYSFTKSALIFNLNELRRLEKLDISGLV